MKKLILFTLAVLVCLGCESSQSSNSQKSSNTNYAELYAKAPLGATPEHFKGGRNASVVIEEFADFQCPTCALIHPTVQELHATYGDRIKIVFRNYPLPIHSRAFDAALAAEAAGFQGKFWDMQNLIFSNQKAWSTSADHRKDFETYAQRLGLDVEKFKADMSGIAARERVQKDIERGRALKVNSTPTFFVNGKPLSYEETEFQRFKAIIDAELQKAGQK
ncbi:MAG: DsbA family protein [Pyrinomonadaceae bacterium]|nr:DsbA family protein [Pyrinomonadaceae bacterium]MCX7640843.1 DsbA family protein [Pyrinomonadaceae bacterium]MDW8303392.1 thioredoxin domain-containing protein [Acidobacteriota bacterium]